MWVGRPSHRRGEGPCRIPAGSPAPSSRSGTGSAPAPAGTPIPTCSFPPTADAARGGPPGRRRRRRSAGAARCGGGARRMPWPCRSPTASGAGCPRRTGHRAGGSPPPAVSASGHRDASPFRAPPAARTSVHYARSSAGNSSLGSNGADTVGRTGRSTGAVDVLWLVLVLLVLLFVQIRNWFGFCSVLVTGTVLLAASWWLPDRGQSVLAYLVTWFLLMAAPRPSSSWRRSVADVAYEGPPTPTPTSSPGSRVCRPQSGSRCRALARSIRKAARTSTAQAGRSSAKPCTDSQRSCSCRSGAVLCRDYVRCS